MRRSQILPFAFVLPWIIIFTVFWLYPIGYSFYLSFTDYSLISPEKLQWIGIGNYKQLFSDAIFLQALQNTLVFCAGTIPLTTVLAILLANAIHRSARMHTFFRASVFLPSIISVTVISLIFIQLYSRDGYINLLGRMMGFDFAHQGILLNENTALAGIMAMDILISTGYFCILFLASIKSISVELFESANIAGANSWHQLRYITLPLIRPMILFSIVIGTIKGFQVFTEIYVMTKGGPLHSTTTAIYDIYELAFRDFNMGYASAASYVLLITISFFAWLQFKIVRSPEY
jgi:multiple sugar transport system permease protein